MVERDGLISALGQVFFTVGPVWQFKTLFDAGQLQFDIPKKGFNLVKLREDAWWRWIRGVWRNVISQPFAVLECGRQWDQFTRALNCQT